MLDFNLSLETYSLHAYSVILQKLLYSLVGKATLTLCREKKQHDRAHAKQSKSNGESHPESKVINVSLYSKDLVKVNHSLVYHVLVTER